MYPLYYRYSKIGHMSNNITHIPLSQDALPWALCVLGTQHMCILGTVHAFLNHPVMSPTVPPTHPPKYEKDHK